MKINNKLIPELESLEMIEKLENRYLNEFGTKPFNISHWNSSKEFGKELENSLKFELNSNYIDYIFSYSIEQDTIEKVLKKLGFNPEKKGFLITPTGTTSILCTITLLKHLEVKVIDSICPVYFSFLNNCKNENMAVEKHYINKENDENLYIDLKKEFNKTLWITNPIYCTNNHLSKENIDDLKIIMDKGTLVIADECLAWDGEQLSHKIGDHKNFIGIYVPHKSLCINGTKFSILVFNKDYQDYFDQWADILYGSMTNSALIAIKHYLSINFEDYSSEFLLRIKNTYNFILDSLKGMSNVEVSPFEKGPFITCYIKGINSKIVSDESKIWEIMKETGCSFIPGHRNHFPSKIEFCFRINLARDSPQFQGAFTRLIHYFLL